MALIKYPLQGVGDWRWRKNLSVSTPIPREGSGKGERIRAASPSSLDEKHKLRLIWPTERFNQSTKISKDEIEFHTLNIDSF